MKLIQYIIDLLLHWFTPDPARDDPRPTPEPLEAEEKTYTATGVTAKVTAKRCVWPVYKRKIRLHKGNLTDKQAKRLGIILHYCKKYKVTDARKVAYIVITAWHESDELLDLTEDRASKTKNPTLYLLQNRYWHTGYWGRGFVQITWESNYRKMGKLLKIDLVRNPDHMLDEHLAAEALVLGMKLGTYTGRKLCDYFNESRTDWVNARRIVNGLDRAKELAAQAQSLYEALESAEEQKKL
jgi:hypothetical protein